MTAMRTRIGIARTILTTAWRAVGTSATEASSTRSKPLTCGCSRRSHGSSAASHPTSGRRRTRARALRIDARRFGFIHVPAERHPVRFVAKGRDDARDEFVLLITGAPEEAPSYLALSLDDARLLLKHLLRVLQE